MKRNFSRNTYSNYEPAFKITKLMIVHEPFDVDQAITEVYRRCKHFPVVGMDCEWIPTRRKNQQPVVSLLQIASVDGFCVLIRTCNMKKMPTSLLDFLSDRNIVKVGVGIFNDGKVLQHKFSDCVVLGRLDIRYLSRSCNVYSKSESLKELTRSLLNYELDKDNVLYYNWDSYVLNDETARYAALDALAGVKIFERLLPLYHEQTSDDPYETSHARTIIEKHFINPRSTCARIFDKKFK